MKFYTPLPKLFFFSILLAGLTACSSSGKSEANDPRDPRDGSQTENEETGVTREAGAEDSGSQQDDAGQFTGDGGTNGPTAPKVAKLALGRWHSCVLTDQGGIKCWGSNTNGQLGLPDRESRGYEAESMGKNLPYVDLGGRKAKDLAAGEEFTCAVLDDGSVECWGKDDKDQLGQRGSEKKVNLGAKAKQVVAGQNHACALLEMGPVTCWGDNEYAQFGEHLSKAFTPLSFGGSVIDLVSGPLALHTCVIVDKGAASQRQLRCWGRDVSGELGANNVRINLTFGWFGGLGDPVDLGPGRTPRVVAVGEKVTYAALDNGSLVYWGNKKTLDTKQVGQGEVVAVGVGKDFRYALLNNREVFSWGNNKFGQLGQGDPNGAWHDPAKVLLKSGLTPKQIAVGENHACILFDSGEVACLGDNRFGQLGLGHTENRGEKPEHLGDNLAFVDLGL